MGHSCGCGGGGRVGGGRGGGWRGGGWRVGGGCGGILSLGLISRCYRLAPARSATPRGLQFGGRIIFGFRLGSRDRRPAMRIILISLGFGLGCGLDCGFLLLTPQCF
jgi:hypothetical protein